MLNRNSSTNSSTEEPIRYPVFIIPKNERTVRFITDYLSLNKKIVMKPYPLPIIGKNIQQLEVFQYVTALDNNMGYYNIRLYHTNQ